RAPAHLARRALDGRARGHRLRRHPPPASGAPRDRGHRPRDRAGRPPACRLADGTDARALRRPRGGPRVGAGDESPLHRRDAPPPGRLRNAPEPGWPRLEVRSRDPRRRPLGTVARSRGPLAALERDRLPDAHRARRRVRRARAGDRQADAHDESPRAARRGGGRGPYGAGRPARRVPAAAHRIPRRLTAPQRLLWLGAFAFFLSFFLLLAVLPLYARAVGVGDRAIGGVLGAFAFASMLMRPWAGWAADRHGRRPLMLAGGLVFVVASLAYNVTAGALGLLAVRLLHGCGMGLYPTAASAVVADLAPPDRRGAVMGTFGAAANIAMALGPIAGIPITDRLGFVPVFWLAVAVGGLWLAAAALAALAVARGAGSLMVAGVLYGAGFGTLTTALLAWCVDLVDEANRGRAMGTYYTALELGIGLGSLGAGFAV